MTITMIMSNILSSCLDLRYPKPDPEPGLLTITRPEPDPKSKSAIRQALVPTHHGNYHCGNRGVTAVGRIATLYRDC